MADSEPVTRQKFGRFPLLELREFRFDFPADSRRFGAGPRLQPRRDGKFFRRGDPPRVLLSQIQNVEHGFYGQKSETTQSFLFLRTQ